LFYNVTGRDNTLKRICETHAAYDPLQYPLLFPYGSNGYHIYLKQRDGKASLTAMQFYNYKLMLRDGNYLLLARDLLNQFIVDMYAKIEAERLLFCRLNQKKLRAEQYCHLKDALNNDHVDNIGNLVILPSSHTGSPRYMAERTQDGMTYVRKYGTADLFITFTCNSKWKEITEQLKPGQTSQHRHDLIARVFKQKLKLLVKVLVRDGMFGDVLCYMCSVEWQKRGN